MTKREWFRLQELFTKLGAEVYKTNEDKGFHANWNTGEKLALVHSEVSEWLEEVRNGNPGIYIKDGKPEGQTVEAADVFIRMLDILYKNDHLHLLSQALEQKTVFNRTRPHMHGRKF